MDESGRGIPLPLIDTLRERICLTFLKFLIK